MFYVQGNQSQSRVRSTKRFLWRELSLLLLVETSPKWTLFVIDFHSLHEYLNVSRSYNPEKQRLSICKYFEPWRPRLPGGPWAFLGLWCGSGPWWGIISGKVKPWWGIISRDNPQVAISAPLMDGKVTNCQQGRPGHPLSFFPLML